MIYTVAFSNVEFAHFRVGPLVTIYLIILLDWCCEKNLCENVTFLLTYVDILFVSSNE